MSTNEAFKTDPDDELERDFDFRRARPNPYAKGMREAKQITVRTRFADGREQLVTLSSLEELAALGRQVILEPEVARYFHDSKTVNDALRPLARILAEREAGRMVKDAGE